MIELGWLTPLIVAVASFAGSWGAMRVELRHIRLELARAHKRLDIIGAPNVTLESK